MAKKSNQATKKQNLATGVEARPPIIAVLGHVDHGKSTLLDYIRKSKTVEQEAGGITQHVAAYEVVHTTTSGEQGRTKEGGTRNITFIDTPGHAAFKAIRSRGANIADIAILVISAEEGVKEQTLEALASILESKTPFVVAINKIDRPNADVDRTKHALLEKGVYLEGLGGEIPWVPVSAITGEGISDLLDVLLLVADMEELKGSRDALAEGYVIEAHRDPKRGIAATLIITDGSMKAGQVVLAGTAVAPLRIMEDHMGKQIREATFSTPVRVVGFNELPDAGVPFRVYKNKKEAEKALLEKGAPGDSRIVSRPSTQRDEEIFLLPLVIKADTSGSLEAIVDQVSSIGNEHSQFALIHGGVGPVNESDIKTALSRPGAQAAKITPIVVAFNVGVDASTTDVARQHDIPIETFDIIYKLTERLEDILKKRTPKRTVKEIVGKAKIIRHFSHRKNIQIIGGKITEGNLIKGAPVVVTRRDIHVGEGRIVNLQSGKQDVDRVEADSEFGAQISAAFEIAQGDVLECVVEKEL